MTDSNGRNSNDANPMGIGTATATPSGTGGGSSSGSGSSGGTLGGGTIGGGSSISGAGSTGNTGPAGAAGVSGPNTGAATAPKPRRAAPTKAGPTTAGPGASPQSRGGSGGGSAKTTVRDEAAKLRNDATSKARDYADQGKEKATSTLDSFAEMMNDAAAEVDERMGEQYGRYARTAADSVASLASTIRQKEVDELLGDARDLVRRSPAIAIGAAAAVGFVVARLIKSGMEQADDQNEVDVEFEPDPAMQRSEFDDLPGA